MGVQRDSGFQSKAVKKFMRPLLAATCLTAASVGAVQASTVIESTDFSGTFAGANPLPVGTDVVTGFVSPNPNPDDNDFFKLSGLTPLAHFNVDFTTQGTRGEVGGQVLTSGEASFGIGSFDLGRPLDIGGTIPADGMLVVRTFFSEGGDYSVHVTTSAAVPGPATSTLFGLGAALAGGLGWRRRTPKR